jgi:sulfur carrier protein
MIIIVLMKITVNNKEKEIGEGYSVKSLLKEMDISAEKTLVTINDETLSLDEFNSVILKENDNVEIFCFVGGG